MSIGRAASSEPGKPLRSADRDVSGKRISVDRIPVICYDFSENRPAAADGGLQLTYNR